MFLTCLVVNIPTLYGNVLEDEEFWEKQANSFDDYWKKREASAEQENKKAYIDDPFSFTGNVTDNITE